MHFIWNLLFRPWFAQISNCFPFGRQQVLYNCLAFAPAIMRRNNPLLSVRTKPSRPPTVGAVGDNEMTTRCHQPEFLQVARFALNSYRACLQKWQEVFPYPLVIISKDKHFGAWPLCTQFPYSTDVVLC